uniref:BHLH domain-containing protein n=1 Tax=Picea sitchensis TaxID=3332 RepID=D5ABX0_PICSI|nr:unknown [Picea sitchensis]
MQVQFFLSSLRSLFQNIWLNNKGNMVGEAEALFLQGRSSNLAAASDPSLLIPSLSINMIESGEDQEATPMGDILCDIFSSHEFSHGNLAANSPVQDFFGILDFLETDNHQEASKFISLIEEESSTCNKNGDNFTEVSHLHELPVLEQESELEPETDHNMLNFSFSANPGGLGCSDTNAPQSINSTSLNHSDSVSSELKDSNKFIRAAVKNRIRSESCKSLLQKSKSCQLRSHIYPSDFSESETDQGLEKPKHKRLKALVTATSDQAEGDGQQRMTHIAVERNRRKQMNEHLAVLRSLMPGFYVQRGDQASIIGGVIEFIKELQQLLQSLESQKQRKTYCTEVLSPRPCSSPRQSLSSKEHTVVHAMHQHRF